MAQPARRLEPAKSLTTLAEEYRAVREATLAFSPVPPAPNSYDHSALGLVYRPLKERNHLAVLVNRAMRRPVIQAFPIEVQINNIGFCNLRCPHCPTHGTDDVHAIYQDKSHTMARSDAEAIARDTFPHALKVATSGNGEGLLHKDLDAIVKGAWRYGTNFFTNTNGTTLLPKLVGSLFGITELRLSLDGATPATFELIRLGAKYQKVMRNVLTLTRANERLPPTLRLIPNVNFGICASNARDVPLMVDLCAHLGLGGLHAFRIVPLNPKYDDDDIFKYPAYYKYYYLQAMQRARGRGINVTLPAPDPHVAPDPLAGPRGGHLIASIDDSYYAHLPDFETLIDTSDIEPEIVAMATAALEAGIERHFAAKPAAVREAAAHASQLNEDLAKEIQRGMATLSPGQIAALGAMHKSDRLVWDCQFLQAHLIYNANGEVRACCDSTMTPIGDTSMTAPELLRDPRLLTLIDEFSTANFREQCLGCSMRQQVPERQIFPLPLN